jgi:hypothetical protein
MGWGGINANLVIYERVAEAAGASTPWRDRDIEIGGYKEDSRLPASARLRDLHAMLRCMDAIAR